MFGIDGEWERLFWLRRVRIVIQSDVFGVQTVSDTAFHHLAVTKNGSNVVFYVDGVADPAVTYNVTLSSGLHWP